MQNEYAVILSEVFCNILMNYAFMFGDECAKDEFPANGDNYMHATVSFSGDRSGSLGISTSPDLCVQLAANILGLDPDDGDSIEDASDALKELLNIACGQFLTATFGDVPIFELSPPSVSEIDETEWKTLLENEETIGIMVDDVPAIVYAFFKSV